MAQRVGRLRRPGGAPEVRAYLLAPPARAGLLLDADARLRRKLAAAERVVGQGIGVLPALARESASSLSSSTPPNIGTASEEGAFTALLERWRDGVADVVDREQCVLAGVASDREAWLAALDDGRIISSIERRVSDSPSAAMQVSHLLDTIAHEPDDVRIRSALAELSAWLTAEQLATTCGLEAPAGPLRRAILHWLETLARALPRHERAAALPLVGRVHVALHASLPVGAERLLFAIAAERRVGDVRKLRSALEIIDRCCGRGPENSPASAKIVALVIACP